MSKGAVTYIDHKTLRTFFLTKNWDPWWIMKLSWFFWTPSISIWLLLITVATFCNTAQNAEITHYLGPKQKTCEYFFILIRKKSKMVFFVLKTKIKIPYFRISNINKLWKKKRKKKSSNISQIIDVLFKLMAASLSFLLFYTVLFFLTGFQRFKYNFLTKTSRQLFRPFYFKKKNENEERTG